MNLSLIISLFNEEKFINKCLDSAINQKLEKMEIICVDDGSTDNTLKILKEYSKKDSRIKIISHENIGLGASRNKAMEIAKGEYIAFLDGDDFLDENALKESYYEAKSKNTDITMFQMINYDNKTGKTYENDWFNLNNLDESFENTVFNSDRTKDFLFTLSVSACQKIYKKSFLKSIDAKFPEGIYFEDNPFFYYVWLKASRISIIRKHFYYRRKHENSITHKCDEKFLDIIPSGNILFEMFIKNDFYKDYKEDLINYKIDAYRLTINSITKDAKEEFYNRTKYEFGILNNGEYKEDFLKYMSKNNKNMFINILKSNSLEEFEKLYTNPKGTF